jgi:hypothetical protein
MLSLIASVTSAPASDRVASLPGWTATLPSPMYSGFLPIAGSQKQLHYVLVEAEAPLNACLERTSNPSRAPILLTRR